MVAMIHTLECYPKEIDLLGLKLPAGEPDHEACSGGQTIKGVLGGWMCPCPCHAKTETKAD